MGFNTAELEILVYTDFFVEWIRGVLSSTEVRPDHSQSIEPSPG